LLKTIIILARLPLIGYGHNRWHVGEVFASIVSRIEDQSLVPEVAKILRENRPMTEWNREYLIKYSLHKMIKEVL
jgi:hypothetical protein